MTLLDERRALLAKSIDTWQGFTHDTRMSVLADIRTSLAICKSDTPESATPASFEFARALRVAHDILALAAKVQP